MSWLLRAYTEDIKLAEVQDVDHPAHDHDHDHDDRDEGGRARPSTSTIGLLGEVALRSHAYHGAILAFESMLNKIAVERAGGAGVLKVTQEALWGELGKVYKALGEEDIALGIFDKRTIVRSRRPRILITLNSWY